MRGKASRSGRSRAPAPVISAKAKPKTSGRSTKLKAASHAGLPPRVALIAASGAVALCAGLILFTGNRMSLVQAGAGRTVYRALGAIGFEMTSLQIAGASPFATDDIVAATGLKKHDPILGIDLHAVRAKVMQVGWVDSATVTRILPGTLVIRVVERTPVAVWQVGGQVGVIDAQGRVIREADPAEFSQLPLVVGAGANASDGSVFALIRARPRLAERLEALVRVDERRWDIRLKSGAIIQLPATNEAEAMITLDQLDQGQDVLELALGRIDLRTPGMVVVRQRDEADAVG
ncbi:MAG: cell division protein FtsQ/DivIB, partial [Alphaproteobacteria bacterium]